MFMEDDRDMKIAGDDFEPVNEAGADVGHEAQLLEQEKENGNLSRARRLGAILADEVSPDTCRLWDKETHEKLDKDRFRRDLGNVEDAYQEVFRRLGIH